MEGTEVEFAYLLANDSKTSTLFKITPPGKKTYYFGTDPEGKKLMALDNKKFNDVLFQTTQVEMLSL